jgi:hypothetical protein
MPSTVELRGKGVSHLMLLFCDAAISVIGRSGRKRHAPEPDPLSLSKEKGSEKGVSHLILLFQNYFDLALQGARFRDSAGSKAW